MYSVVPTKTVQFTQSLSAFQLTKYVLFVSFTPWYSNVVLLNGYGLSNVVLLNGYGLSNVVLLNGYGLLNVVLLNDYGLSNAVLLNGYGLSYVVLLKVMAYQIVYY